MNKKQLLIGAVTAILGVILVSSLVVEKRLSDLRTHLDSRIAEQTTVVGEVAQALAKNTINEDLVKIIPECSTEESTVYDTLLSSLDKGLSAVELVKLDALFAKCGDVVAARRAGMSLLLNRETALLEELVVERDLLGDFKSEETNIEKFVKLAEAEQKVSVQFMTLVQAQGKIIAALKANIPATAVSVESIRAEAQVVREELDRLIVEVTTLRADLFNS